MVKGILEGEQEVGISIAGPPGRDISIECFPAGRHRGKRQATYVCPPPLHGQGEECGVGLGVHRSFLVPLFSLHHTKLLQSAPPEECLRNTGLWGDFPAACWGHRGTKVNQGFVLFCGFVILFYFILENEPIIKIEKEKRRSQGPAAPWEGVGSH